MFKKLEKNKIIMFKRKKKIDLHGFNVITSRDFITITDDKKLWSVSLKKGTAWHTSLEYQLKNDLENAKRLISILWVTEIMLSDPKCMKEITKAILKVRKVLYSDKFTFIPNNKNIKVISELKDWEATFAIGTKWNGSLNYHLMSDDTNARALIWIFYACGMIFTDVSFVKELQEILIRSHKRMLKAKPDEMAEEDERLYLRGLELLNEK